MASRRDFLAGGLALAAGHACGQTPAGSAQRVLIVGGGWGGLTAAYRLRQAAPDLEVTLVEREAAFRSLPLSNAWVVGRTPELLGKKVEVPEITLAAITILVFPLSLLLPAAAAISAEWGQSAMLNTGPHGWTEILYAFSSAAGNNGSAFAGLSTNTPVFNSTMAASMLLGRFGMMFPALALGASLAKRRAVSRVRAWS